MSVSHPVQRVTLTHLQVPLKEPIRIEGAEVAIQDAILVTVESEGGFGLGECSPGPGDGASAACWDELAERIVPELLGSRFSTPEEIDVVLAGRGGSRVARAGAELACWDLLGQSRHEPIAELLGASPEQVERGAESGLSVGLYPTIVELIKTIDTHLSEGYRRVRIAIAPGRDVELVRAVRQHFGDIPLMVDAEGTYSRDDLDVFRALDEFDLLMIEQPLPAGDLEGLAAIQAAIATPVCLDETADTLEHCAAALERGAGRIVNLKIQRVGGLGPALAMHDLCHAHGAACWVGTTPELGIGQAPALHLAALGNCRYPTDVEPSTRWFVDDYIVPLIELSAPGLLRIPTRPGLGFQLDPAKVRRYQVRHLEFAPARADG